MQAQTQRVAAAYIRVSTDDQTDLSPESQLEKIREYAAKTTLFCFRNTFFEMMAYPAGRQENGRDSNR